LRTILDAFLKGRFSFVLCTMVAMFFVMPLVGNTQGMVDKLFGWLNIAVLISCLRAISQSRRFFFFMVVFTIVNIFLGSSELMIEGDQHYRIGVLGSRIAYFILVFFSIMRFVLNRDPVTTDKICGAITAYFLLGIIWSFIYTIFYDIDPTSISVPPELVTTETVNSYWAIYFSFTTLTTMGYGDITPQTSLTQSYAIMQAAIGQIFLAVIIARLIALQISHAADDRAQRGRADKTD
jgi:hypothetical protein